MLKLELCQSFSVHINIPKEELNVNDLIVFSKNASHRFFQLLFEKLVASLQQSILEQFLGAAWKPQQSIAAPWECPRCRSRYGFRRRGRRTRSLKTSVCSVSFSLFQVTCCDCNKTFSPFPKLFAIASRHQISRELEQLMCSVVKDLSYAKTAKTVNLFCEVQLSPHSVHKTVQHYGARATIVEDLSHITHLEIDSTKIKAADNERGIDVHLALSVGASHRKGKRIYRDKHLVNVEVAQHPETTKQVLKKSHVDQVVLDGHSGLEGYIQKEKLPMTIQRCLFHVPRTAAHMLYLDGLSCLEGRDLVKPMKKFLFNENISVKKRLRQYDRLLFEFRKNGYTSTCKFLENARPNLYTYKQFAETDLHGRTISIVERQFREVNRRMENGARWTPVGAQNLLNLKLIEELNNQSYDYLWKVRKKRKSSFEVILC